MPNQDVEANLADLAVAEISDKIPSLMDDYLGFDLITKNDEGTRAAGLLGFKIRNEIVYIPVLWLNGKIKGTEMLYLKNADVFTSCTKQWIEYLKNRTPGTMGESYNGDLPHEVSPAQLRIFARPPMGATKNASLDLVEEFIDKAKAAAPLPEGFNVPAVLKSMGKKAYLEFFNYVTQKAPALLEKLSYFYDPKELQITEFEKTADDPQPDQEKAEEITEDSSKSKVRFVTIQDAYENPSDLSSDEKKKVMSEGVLVIDKRKPEEKSSLITEEYRLKFEQPSTTGIYEMLNGNGNLSRVLIVVKPFLVEDVNSRAPFAVIIDPESKEYGSHNMNDHDIYCRARLTLTDEAVADGLKGEKSISEATPGKTYVLVNEKMEISAPFDVRNKMSGADAIQLTVRSDWRIANSVRDQVRAEKGLISEDWGSNCCSTSCDRESILRAVDKESGRIDSMGGITFVPKNWKIVEVSETRWTDRAKELSLTPAPGKMIDSVLFNNGVYPLLLEKVGFKFAASYQNRNLPWMDKMAAIQMLVEKIGLGGEEALKLIKEANEVPQHVWIKSASVHSSGGFPSMDDRVGATRWSGVPEQTGIQQQEPQPTDYESQVSPYNADLANWDKIQDKDLQFLMRAADSGSKQVFDPAMIGMLLKTNRTQMQVEKFLPDFVNALDKMCRMLLLFYWHNADFSENYGEDELAEMEEVLLNNIKNNGMLVLFLKQKSVDSSSSEVDAFSTAGN